MAYLSSNEREKREPRVVLRHVSAPRHTLLIHNNLGSSSMFYDLPSSHCKGSGSAAGDYFRTESHMLIYNAADLNSSARAHTLMFTVSFSNSDAHVHTEYLGSVSVPAQVLREAVKADVVGLTLSPCRAEGQAVVVLLHLLHLQHDTHRRHRKILKY